MFVLFYFLDEDCEGIGRSDMIIQDENGEDVTEDRLNNWDKSTLVLVKWPGERGGKDPSSIHSAKILKIADTKFQLLNEDGETENYGKGKRLKKPRKVDDDDSDLEVGDTDCAKKLKKSNEVPSNKGKYKLGRFGEILNALKLRTNDESCDDDKDDCGISADDAIEILDDSSSASGHKKDESCDDNDNNNGGSACDDATEILDDCISSASGNCAHCQFKLTRLESKLDTVVKFTRALAEHLLPVIKENRVKSAHLVLPEESDIDMSPTTSSTSSTRSDKSSSTQRSKSSSTLSSKNIAKVMIVDQQTASASSKFVKNCVPDSHTNISGDEEKPVYVSNETLKKLTPNPSKMATELLSALFTRNEMATHSLTGQKANTSLAARPQLDPDKVNAIMTYIRSKFENFDISRVRLSIRDKLSNEKKAFQKKMKTEDVEVKEN